MRWRRRDRDGVTVRDGRRRGRRRAPLWRIVRGVAVVLVGYYLLCVGLLVVYRFVPPPTTGVQVQRRVESLFTGGDYRKVRRRVALEALPPHVPRAVVAAEDGRFWQHSGFDWEEMRVAREEAAGRMRIRGASTITLGPSRDTR